MANELITNFQPHEVLKASKLNELVSAINAMSDQAQQAVDAARAASQSATTAGTNANAAEEYATTGENSARHYAELANQYATQAEQTTTTTLNNLHKVVKNISIATSDWKATTEEEETAFGFAYCADITIEGVTTDYVALVNFALEESLSANYAPVAVTYDGFVRVFACEVPNKTIIVGSVVCIKDGV